MDNFRLTNVEKLVNQTLTLEMVEQNRSEDGDVDSLSFAAKVKEVKPSPCNGGEWEAFKVLLEIPSGQHVLECNYVLKHDSIGEVTLFGSPNSPEELEFICSFERKNLS